MSNTEITRLQRRIKRSSDSFSLFFIECVTENEVALSELLHSQLKLKIVDLPKPNDELIPFDLVIAEQLNSNDKAVCIKGLDSWLLDELLWWQTITHLNWRRNAFQRMSRPVVFVLSKPALDRLAKYAPDFFDYQSGVFVFP